ncbi:MAG: chemotaxis response regulator protein-glutamate methylesterase [Rhizobiales bacterium]|nr:chemotaxis response regulator protein-glutamate methylesterase [Hyphomicrobiales bacterium]
MKKTRVLIVDDSPTMRALVAATLRRDPEIEVIGSAGDPLEAREAIKALNPDVLTLDIEMPKMDGLAFLEKIMRLRPMPVIMVSTLTHHGAEASIRALEIGAFDCIGKPLERHEMSEAFADLPEKVKAAGRASIRSNGLTEHAGLTPSKDFRANGRVVAIGSSTGGVEALLTVIARFPENCPPTVITQHMPAAFTPSFAARLDRCGAAQVSEAYDGAPLQPGQVYLAPGGAAHLEVVGSKELHCRLRADDLVNGHRPSVDVLLGSVARTAGANAIGVILTGMGKDGARGLLEMRQAGSMTFGQDEASCVVYGMPKAAFELGAVTRQLPIETIGTEIIKLCDANQRDSHASSTLN